MKNPLEEYRRAQRALRKDFDAFTSAHCATCPAPCCVRPARIAPTDILLAEGIGWKAQVEQTDQTRGGRGDAVVQAAGQAALALGGTFEDVPNPPCQYLGVKGCTFPKDLRPFGCTAYICPIMRERLDKKTLGRMKRLVRDLEQTHETLMTTLHRRHGTDIGDD
jgi:hypothetical protein